MRSTYTYSTMDVSAATYAEIKGILLDAGYHHCINGDGVIDMKGIGIELKKEVPKCTCCGTIENVHPDSGSGGPYRCNSPDCIVF